MKKSAFTKRHLIQLIGLIMISFAQSICFVCMSIFYPPVTEYLGVGQGPLAIYYTLQFLAMSVTMPIASKIYLKYNLKVILSIAMAITCGTFFLLANGNALWQWYLGGILFGIANAYLFYLVPPTLVGNWFKKKYGIFLALVSCFTGVAGVFLTPVAAIVMSNSGWRMAYIFLGIVTGAVGLPATIFIVKRHPSECGLEPYGQEAEAVKAVEEGGTEQLPGVPVNKALMSVPFIFAALSCMCIGLMGGGVMSFIPNYVNVLGYGTVLGGLVASIAQAGNLSGKFIMGGLSDKKPIYGFIAGLGLGGLGLLTMVYLNGLGVPALVIGTFMFGIVMACIPILAPAITTGAFGKRDFTKIYAYFSMICALCSAFGATIFGFAHDALGPELGFTISAIVSFSGILFGAIALRLGRKMRAEYGDV